MQAPMWRGWHMKEEGVSVCVRVYKRRSQWLCTAHRHHVHPSSCDFVVIKVRREWPHSHFVAGFCIQSFSNEKSCSLWTCDTQQNVWHLLFPLKNSPDTTIGAVKLIVLGKNLAEDVTGKENVFIGHTRHNHSKKSKKNSHLSFISYLFQAQ